MISTFLCLMTAPVADPPSWRREREDEKTQVRGGKSVNLVNIMTEYVVLVSLDWLEMDENFDRSQYRW